MKKFLETLILILEQEDLDLLIQNQKYLLDFAKKELISIESNIFIGDILKEYQFAAAEISGTNTCVSDMRLAGLFIKHRLKFKALQNKYCSKVVEDKNG